MSKYANLTMSLTLSSGGRPTVITRTPFSAVPFAATSPPASMTTNTPGVALKVQLQAGNNQIVVPSAYLTGYNALLYWIFVPPSTSTISKNLRGATTDTGVPLIPNLPMVLALPTTIGSIYIWAGAAEVIDSVWL